MVHESTTSGMTLGELARALAAHGASVTGDASVRVTDVRQDSRRIAPGDLFVARAGGKCDGASFAGDAVLRGARAVMVERGAPLPDVAVPVLTVHDLRRAVGFAAAAVHGHPARAVRVVGITGTNGKTTTSFLTQAALLGAGARAARLGTLGFAFEGESLDLGLTTPEADDLTRLLSLVRDRGGSHLVMEVSSHALTLGRVEALEPDVAVFSNLTQDHLDLHGSMEAYAAAKLRLFTELSPRASVVNVDDPHGVTIASMARGRVLRVSKQPGAADVCPMDVSVDASGIRGRVRLPSGEVELASRLVGRHNLDNLLASLAVVDALGLDPSAAARGLGEAPGVPGRLERCDGPEDDVLVLVDYSHTPDALERALTTCRSLGRGEVICVFGCGGDRDRQKRPLMGDAVGRQAHRAIVTNDNPRSEEPEAIAAAIVPGLARHGIPFEVELDRACAIERAVTRAAAGDVVLVAGKGHEPYQIIGSERRDFDDRVEARRALARRRGGTR
jgi:UDP-N-acetylmuramoyl-L-alanyl-D-glutamate--2,6-diaminopimelate ligase